VECKFVKEFCRPCRGVSEVVAYPGVPLRSTPGYFLAGPPGLNMLSIYLRYFDDTTPGTKATNTIYTTF